MFKEAMEAPIGSTITIPIYPAPNRVYAEIETVAVMSAAGGAVELAGYQIQGRNVSQQFAVIGNVGDESSKGIRTGALQTDSVMFEVAVLKMSVPTAGDVGMLLIEHTKKVGFPLDQATKDRIRAVLDAE